MRSWVWGGCLAALTGGGVYLVFTGATGASHCGPCVACSVATAAPTAAEPDCSAGACPSVGVTELVDVPAELSRPVPAVPFVSFDEPPLANPHHGTTPVMARPVPTAGVVTVGFIEPIADGVEVAPRPRKAVPNGEVPFGSLTDPF